MARWGALGPYKSRCLRMLETRTAAHRLERGMGLRLHPNGMVLYDATLQDDVSTAASRRVVGSRVHFRESMHVVGR